MPNNTNFVTVDQNACCPCGSHKTFSHCCMEKKHVYEYMSIDKSGKRIIYDHTEFVNAVKGLNSFIDARITNIETSLNTDDAFRKLKKLFEKLGEALAPIQSSTSCKAGCDHCCHLLVLTSQLEIEYIKAYMKSHYSSKELESFQERINKYRNLLSSIVENNDGTFTKESQKAYSSVRVPCAFLDENHRCMIYEVRPFICRKYLVFNDPKICENPANETSHYYSPYQSNVKDAIIKLNKLAYGTNYRYMHLLSWFSQQ